MATEQARTERPAEEKPTLIEIRAIRTAHQGAPRGPDATGCALICRRRLRMALREDI
ncbi:hypothetical protein [Streptomyces chromofuscus]|uniref:Uncharacterized protein n=1 Tax=Streptomyces chromofuscus TaxID=42881 RepID=A0A7M2T9G1_STRCW|nr:hypothetical protein [Streptomyces chromofuscus]QOV44575.1 hypothetical protein IPT68_00550 [Streptomyces chromofuscus]